VGQLYQFPPDLDGTGQTIGILELGGGYRPEDLSAYFAQIGVPLPNVTAVSVDHGRNAPSDPQSADGEVMLDIEVAAAVAPKARIVVYFASGATDRDFLDALTQAVHDTVNRPSVISISWGGPETRATDSFQQQFDEVLQSAATLGITVTAASGDSGAADEGPREWDGVAHVDFPASSPYALACGGTRISVSDNAITSETVWNQNAADSQGDSFGAGGGGISTIFPVPSYQESIPLPKNQSTGTAGRGVPDVAGDADPASGYLVRVDGQEFPIGGTSAVAPLWAGLIALINQSLGRPVGFINPILYANPQAFRDITSGSNRVGGQHVGYDAGPGWDACTGLGSPIGGKILAALGKAVKPAQAAGNAVQVRLFEEPVFNEGTPLPDPGGFIQDNNDRALYTAAVDALLLKRVVSFDSARGDPGSLLSLQEALGAQGPDVIASIQKAGQIVFHALGDSGASDTRYYPGELSVFDHLTADAHATGPAEAARPSFLYHLGDVVYEFGESRYYYDQFYDPLRNYPAPVFAIPGNHDSFVLPGTPPDQEPLKVFSNNFCAATPAVTAEAGSLHRTAMTQPGVYFALDVPFARIIGLFSNALEDPGVISGQKSSSHPWSVVPDVQLQFLEAQLAQLKGYQGAIILAVHHPPFGYAPQGNPGGGGDHGGSPLMLADIDTVCKSAGVYPHAVISGHKHNYQRFTRTIAWNGSEISVPFVVCGNGGHHVTPIVQGRNGTPPAPLSGGMDVAYLDQNAVVDSRGLVFNSYNQSDYGYLRITVNAQRLNITFNPVRPMGAASSGPDTVVVNLAAHTVAT